MGHLHMLHLTWWGEALVYHWPMYLGHTSLWPRYINNILMVWNGGIHELHDFISKLNINNKNIKFTYYISKPYLSLTLQNIFPI